MGAVPPVSLLERVRDRIRIKHYRIRTKQAYCDWIRRLIIFHGKRHLAAHGAAAVAAIPPPRRFELRIQPPGDGPG